MIIFIPCELCANLSTLIFCQAYQCCAHHLAVANLLELQNLVSLIWADLLSVKFIVLGSWCWLCMNKEVKRICEPFKECIMQHKCFVTKTWKMNIPFNIPFQTICPYYSLVKHTKRMHANKFKTKPYSKSLLDWKLTKYNLLVLS